MSRQRRFITSLQSHSHTRVLALDIGSSNTRIKQGEKVIFDEPTCIAFHRGSGAVVAVGKKAYQLLGKNTAQLDVVFPVEYGAVSSASAFESFFKVVSQRLGSTTQWLLPFTRDTVFTALPDWLSPVERSQFLKSLQSVGLGKVIPVSAATAAATTLKRINNDSPVCLIHIGAQTTQITVLGGGEVAAATKCQWGGLQFTEAVQETIRAKDQCGVSWHVAEALKKEICYIESPVTTRQMREKKMSIQGKDITTQLGKTVVVTAESFIPTFQVIMSDLLLNIQLFFAQLPTDLATTAISSGIVLTGGGSRLRGLSEYLTSQLHTEVVTSDQPEQDVIAGIFEV